MISRVKEGYFIEFNGEFWQSVFPSNEAVKSQLHTTVEDAIFYMCTECGVDATEIRIINVH